MLKFSANIGLLFTELPFEERFQAARHAGFTAVEFPCPKDMQPAYIAKLLRKADLQQSLANMPYEMADLGIAASPGKEVEFLSRLNVAFNYADATECRTLHVLAGKRPDDTLEVACDDALKRNLEIAAYLASKRNMNLVIEAINRRDVPAFSLSNVHHAARIVQELGLSNVLLLLDLYHAGTVGEDIYDVVAKYGPDSGYVQIAGFKNRNEPDDGAEDYVALLAHLTEVGYGGYVGCEYRPAKDTRAGLTWFSQLIA